MAKRCRVLWGVLLTLLTVLCMGLVACGGDKGKGKNEEKPPVAVSAESLTYDGETIQWQAVSGATSYVLTINGKTYTAYNNGQYQFPYTSDDNYEITIVAKNSYGSSEGATRSFRKLVAPENVLFSATGEMTWSAVVGASSYIVEVNNTEKPVNVAAFNDFVYGQRNNIRVKASGGPDTFGVWSTLYQKEYLGVPTNIAYDGQYLTWTGSNNASGYTMYVNGMEYSDISNNKYLYDSGNHDFSVEIRAEGNGQTIFPSKLSEAQDFIFLGAVTNIHVDDNGSLVWDKVEKATSYTVKMTDVNNNKSEETAIEPKVELQEGKQTRVQIKPLATGNATYFSTFSAEETFGLLRSPSLEWEDDFKLTDGDSAAALNWNNPTGEIAGYNVKVVFTPADGSPKTTRIDSATVSNPTYSYNYPDVGVYEMQVQSLSSVGSDWSNSRYSKVLTVIRLAAPTRTSDDNFIVSDPTDVTKGFTVNFQGVSGAFGYVLRKNGAATGITAGSSQSSIKVTQVVDATTTSEVTDHYAVQCVGGTKTVSGATVVTLGSLDDQSLLFDITVSAAPSAETLDISGNSIIWGSVPNVSAYAVNTGDGGVQTVTNNQYSLSNITTVGNHEIMVCSVGNGRNVLPSNYSKSFSVYKLHKPTNIKIATDENEGKLSWEWGDSYAQGYNLYVNGDSTPIANANIDNMNQYVKDGGVAVIVQATGNYWNTERTIYYTDSDKSDTSIFKKLEAVTFPAPYISGTNLIWNAPSNVTGSANVSYQVYIDSYLQNQRIDGTSMDLSHLEAGKHRVKIRCIGDGVTTINSEESDEIEIRRLETPTLGRTQTQYTWNSVSSATQYQIYIGDTLLDTITHGPSEYFVTPRFNALSDQTVRVIAIGSPEAGIMDSKPDSLTQKITQLPAPSFTYSYDKEHFATDGKITIKATSGNPNVSGFTYTRNGVSTVSENATFAFTTDSATKYEMSVAAKGGVFDADGMYWADSLPSATKSVTIHAKPNASNIAITQDGEISGFAIKDVGVYILTITYRDGTPEKVVSVSSAIYQDSNYRNIDTITFISKGTISANEEIDAVNAYISSEPITWTKI